MIRFLIEISVCQLVLYGFYHLLLRNDKHFGQNRWYLLLSAGMACIIPMLEFSTSSPVSSSVLSNTPFHQVAVTISQSQEKFMASGMDNFSYSSLLYLIYFTGCCLSLILLLNDIVKLVQIINHSRIERKTGYTLVYLENISSVFSFFHYIFWDDTKALKPAAADQLLQHEQAHIHQKHTFDLLFIELLKIIFWFNPVIHLYKRALCEQHEFLADQAVMLHTQPDTYCQFLIKNLFQKLDIDFTHSFSQINVKKRINMIYKTKPAKAARLKMLLLLPVTFSLLLVFSYQGWAQLSVEPYDLRKINIQTLYLNCGNPLSLDLPEMPEGAQVSYKIKGGELLKGEKENDVIIIPAASKVFVEAYPSETKLKDFTFFVRKIPDPEIQPVVNGVEFTKEELELSLAMLSDLNVVVIPDKNLKKFLPDDANYYPRGEVSLVRNDKTITTTKMNGSFDHTGFAGAQAGDKINIAVNQIYRIDFRGQQIDMPLKKRFEILVIDKN